LNLVLSAVIFLVVISIVVIVHEFGHFIAAIKSGVKVEEIAWGFPPKLWSKTRSNIRYVINLIPVGGYVKLLGDDGSEENDPKSLATKSAPKKIFIFLAGVFCNFILAFLIFLFLYAYGFQPIDSSMAKHAGISDSRKVRVETVEKDSPAEKEGINKDDVVKKIEGAEVKNSVEAIYLIQKEVQASPDKPIKLTFERNGAEFDKEIKTYKSKQKVNDKEIEVNRIGVVLKESGKIQASLFLAPVVAFEEILRQSGLTIMGFVGFLGQLVSKLQVSENVSGPIGIFVFSGSVFEMGGIAYLVQFTAMISIALAVVNMLPIPALDGGHTLVVIVESISRRKLPQKTKNVIQFAGFGALILLMIIVTLKDVFTFIIK